MNAYFRRIAAAAIAACGISSSAWATTASIDYTDIWYNPTESGWGINIIQQGATLFATLFVYEGDRLPHWFVASEMNGGPAGFSGPLYQISNGAPYSGPWTGTSPATAVGSISVNFGTASTGTLQYSVGAITVTKSIQRQSFRANNLAGLYYGGLSANSNCGASLAQGLITITHAGTAFSMQLDFIDNQNRPQTCRFNGTYTATGRLATVTGTAVCVNVPSTFTLSEVEASRNGLTAAFTMTNNPPDICTFNGHFGATRDLR